MSRASDIAYLEIRAKILSGELAPGSQLKEEELADICKVSRTPIRDALRRLEAEMFVRRTDTQRTYVPEWTSGDIEEVFTLRAMLEGHAAARAAERITGMQIDQLRLHNDLIAKSMLDVKNLDIDSFLQQNRLFHDLVIETAASTRLAGMLSKLVEQPIVHRTALGYDQREMLQSHTEHEQLIAAFRDSDGQWAQSVMTSHIRRAYHAYEARRQVRD
ncbi:GntR family transcriptional regulator [Govanella unica]|uniref:GntR family transcriptional regulator n=1 Tax=Govanella unica TaxID=2975056 RepID=A0A9X3TYQ4_9PROT|nr:GntR family transcriptional regulator [Govania unica]MDA5194170.1 GntR family transcriptional regulator [Govania unica]